MRRRLWRASDPILPDELRDRLVGTLLDTCRAVGVARRSKIAGAEAAARAEVDDAKRALGERWPVWWSDGPPDLNRHMVRNTPMRSGMRRWPDEHADKAGPLQRRRA